MNQWTWPQPERVVVGALKFSRWEMVCVPPPNSASSVKKVALICVLLFVRQSYLEALVKVQNMYFLVSTGGGKWCKAKKLKKNTKKIQWRNMKLWWGVYNGVEVIWNVQSLFCRPTASWEDIAGILGAVIVTMKTWILLVSVVHKCLVP